MRSWQTTSSKVAYENPWIKVYEDTVIMPNGKEGLYGYVASKSDSVFIIPIDSEGNTYLINQEQYPIKRTAWQFVGGRADGQAVEEAAKRELLEETGLKAKSITVLNTSQVAMGTTTYKATFCLATDITPTDAALDPEEGILEVKKVPFVEIETKIQKGEIDNVESIVLYFLAKSHLQLK